jgi:hypothetical protein
MKRIFGLSAKAVAAIIETASAKNKIRSRCVTFSLAPFIILVRFGFPFVHNNRNAVFLSRAAGTASLI